MQKRYQIESQRAVQQFHQFASDVNPTVQTILPMADIVGMLQEGVGHLMREAGLLLMMGIMEEEVRHVVGERYAQNRERQNSRGGKEQGYCVVNGQKVPIQRGTNTDPGKAGSEAGQLRTIPAPWAVASGGVGQDDAEAMDAEVRTGDES